MKEVAAMPVNVPKPWRIAGRVVVVLFAVLCGFFGYVWFIADRTPPSSDLPMTLFSLLNFLAGALLLIPCFVGYYPGWMVRIVGRERLQKMVDQCRDMYGPQRVSKATAKSPESWFTDMRVIGLLMVLGLCLAGLMLSIRSGS